MDFLLDYILNFYGPTPYLIVFAVLLACGLGIPIPEDITLFVAGLICYYGLTKLWLMIILGLFGVLIGDATIFYLGLKHGRKLTKKWFFHQLLPDERLNSVRDKLHKSGGTRLLFFARFMPGLRAPIYFSAGTLHIPFRKFIFYDGMAALISVPAIIGAVYYFGDEVNRVIHFVKKVEHGVVVLVVLIVLAVIGKWYITHRKLKKNK
ncbi:MAG: DedA family protein [Bdellovibrio sp.]|nr:DedA family protein [Bdellovibrio sp.]